MTRRWRIREAMGLSSGLRSLAEQSVVAGEDDREDGARVEVGGGEQADLGEHRVAGSSWASSTSWMGRSRVSSR